MSTKILRNTYNKKKSSLWSGERTMDHASGIWGRLVLFQYLKSKITKKDKVVDLGCGAGYPSYYLTKYVGEGGKVFGYDNSKILIDIAKEYCRNQKNLSFVEQDVTKKLPLKSDMIDCFVSFMLIQNLRGIEIDKLLKEIKRCLKHTGYAVFLTIHPEIFKSEWKLDFIQYSKKKILEWRKNKQNDLLIKGFVKNSTGGKKSVFMYSHSRKQIDNLLENNKLKMVDDIPIYVDQKTASEFFGQKHNRKYPTTPIFWIFSVMKTAKV